MDERESVLEPKAEPAAEPTVSAAEPTVSAAESTAESTAESVEQAELAALYEALAAERQKAEDYLNQMQRLKADFDNYRRRMVQEQARWREQAAGEVLMEVLPVLDNLERALAAQGSAGSEALARGVELTVHQFRTILDKLGVEPIPTAGQPFDPNLHEAMLRAEDPEQPEDIVLAELQKGYKYKGEVLRPALVKVSTHS